LKKTSVRSQDQRRMLKTTTHSFPSNVWIHKITKGKESNKCDLCKALWIAEHRFTTEAVLPEQHLGHIQLTCEALSAADTAAHHRCWRVIYGELARQVSLQGMEIHVHHGREKSTDNLGRADARIRKNYTI
jgi:hypothetical protein